ncbi:hypothetical protein LQ327_05915 [Actinomycetospora endophytica]|uniref:Excreted virulence factor EspC (Type VII ESX diderm) n=1 Tax=Actinomycetospora endophytica TaxID=2291215 RepID=A0ABS8P795_9PSEU|nr:hypothetical protein [Actinomycetospora endophytica]MCD2192924.1 hypothetical protein [Actinomycetospora endophytica]
MPDLVYGSAAIEQARVAASAQARRIPALADVLGAGSVDLGVDGLEAGGSLTGALADLRAALESELTAGGARMDEVDRALDATLRSMQGADSDSASGVRAVTRGASGLSSGTRTFSSSGLGALAALR